VGNTNEMQTATGGSDVQHAANGWHQDVPMRDFAVRHAEPQNIDFGKKCTRTRTTDPVIVSGSNASAVTDAIQGSDASVTADAFGVETMENVYCVYLPVTGYWVNLHMVTRVSIPRKNDHDNDCVQIHFVDGRNVTVHPHDYRKLYMSLPDCDSEWLMRRMGKTCPTDNAST
jgi:hypothetical protein